MGPQHQAVIGLGANLGNTGQTLQRAWQALADCSELRCKHLSAPYRSQPVGMESTNWFLNAVGIVTTTLSPLGLLEVLQRVEYQFGRRRDLHMSGYKDRPLDLDLLLYEDCILNTAHLTLPHPQMTRRRFVLTPLLELAGEIRISPFDSPLPDWTKAHLPKVANQQVVASTW